MSRVPGVFPISANYEVNIAEPLDARSRVSLQADLIAGEIPYPYNGMMVTVYGDSDPLKNGTYWLKDASNVTLIASWKRLDSPETTDELEEGVVNLYFTPARARQSISAVGDFLQYNNTTGALSTSYTPENIANKGVAGGYVPLNISGKINTSYLPDSVLGNLRYGGTYNGTVIAANMDLFPELNGVDLPSTAGYTGIYFISTANFTRTSVDYVVGDWVVHNGGGVYVKVDNSDAITSFNGRIGPITLVSGDVTDALGFTPITNLRTITINGVGYDLTANRAWTLTTADISEGGGFLYYNDTRARAALSFAAGSGAYNSSTGVITIPTDTIHLANSAGYLTFYNETDTLASVTGRGATTSTALTFNGGFTSSSGIVTGAFTIQPTGDATLTVRANTSGNTARILFNNGASSIWALFKDSTVADFRLYNYNLAAFAMTVNVATNAFTFGNSITATSIIRSGGTSAQFLKADGSIDTSAYITAAALSGYATESWVNSALTNYYTLTQIQNFFSGASAMTGYNKSNWDTAYGWGNHAGLYQPLDSDLTAIAALNTAPFGRSLLTLADAASAPTWNQNTTGNAATSDYTDFLLSQGSILTSQLGVAGSVYYSSAITYPQTGLFPASDNSNSILTLNRHPGDYYSQLGFSSDANIYYRRFSATAINTTQPWIALVQNSGTWSISITGDANTVDGFHASQSTVANNVVVRDASGYITGTYVNMSDDGNPGTGTSISSFITKQGDNYYRSVSPTNAMVSIRGVANGTWGIDITGQAGYLQLQAQGSGSVSVASGITAIYRSDTGNGAALPYAPVLHVGGGDTRWQLQGSYGTGNGTLYFREGMNGSYGSWLTVLTNANFNSYALPLTAGSGNVITGSLYINSSIFTSNATYLDIYNNTSDGADNKITRIGGGGDVTSSRGATIDLRGNEVSVNGGSMYLNAGGSGSIYANATFNGTALAMSGNATIGGTLGVTGLTTLNDLLTINTPTSSFIQYKVSGTTYGYSGVAYTTNSIVTGSVLGDMVHRTVSKDFLVSTNDGSSVAFRLAAGTGVATFSSALNGTSLSMSGGGSFGSTLRIGGSLKSWDAFEPALQIKTMALGSSGQSNGRIFTNTYYDGNYRYQGTGTATMYEADGGFFWSTAASGVADGLISWAERMRLTTAGNLLIKTTTESPNNEALQVAGSGFFTSTLRSATYLSAGTIISPLYSEQLTVGVFDNPKITLAATGGYRWSTYVDGNAGDANFRIRYEDGSIEPLVIARSGAITASSSLLLGVGESLSVRNTAATTITAVKGSYFGYSSSYPALLVGTTGSASLFFNVDVVANTGGSFNGSGNEYIWRNTGFFKTPNAANNEYNTLFSWSSAGQITFNNAAAFLGSLSAASAWTLTSSNSPYSGSAVALSSTGYGAFVAVDGAIGSKYFGMKTDGTFYVAGGVATFNSSVVATVFNGAGTGLTGYASGLNIGGYSIYTNYMYAQGLGTGSMDINGAVTGVYRNENGNGGNLSYAPVLHVSSGDAQWQIQGDYYNSSTLQWRAGYNGTWYAWRNILHSGNYNSYSPTLTGTGATGDWDIGTRYLYTTGNMLTELGSGKLYYTSAIVSSTTGLFPTGDNSNGIITLNRHPGTYYSQLGFNSNGQIYYRSFNATAINDSQAWQLILHVGNSPYAYNMNQYVRTTDNVTFNQVTATLIGISSGVTVNYNNDSASTYQMLWGSGNYVYGTAGIYCNPNTDWIYAARFSETSDRTLKEVITENILVPGIENITPHLYKKKGAIELGYFAQDVQPYLPHAVTVGSNGKLTLTYRDVFAAKIYSVETRTEKLERRVKELEAELTKLKMQ